MREVPGSNPGRALLFFPQLGGLRAHSAPPTVVLKFSLRPSSQSASLSLLTSYFVNLCWRNENARQRCSLPPKRSPFFAGSRSQNRQAWIRRPSVRRPRHRRGERRRAAGICSRSPPSPQIQALHLPTDPGTCSILSFGVGPQPVNFGNLATVTCPQPPG